MSVIDRLKKEPELLQKYGDTLREQEQRGFIEKVKEILEPTAQLPPRPKIHDIPHNPVKKKTKTKNSTTTPIGIVYECNCKSSQKSLSLNDCLINTPQQLNDLTSILLRFRYNEFAFCTDIEKTFSLVLDP